MLSRELVDQVVDCIVKGMGLEGEGSVDRENLPVCAVDDDGNPVGYTLTFDGVHTIGFVESSAAIDAMKSHDHIVMIDVERNYMELLPGFMYGNDPLVFGLGVDPDVVHQDYMGVKEFYLSSVDSDDDFDMDEFDDDMLEYDFEEDYFDEDLDDAMPEFDAEDGFDEDR